MFQCLDLFYRFKATRYYDLPENANMKVQTATCEDNNNSKSRAATYVKFEMDIK